VPFGEWWYVNQAILEAIRVDCRDSHTPVLFVYHPSRAWLQFPAWRAHMQSVRANFIDLTAEQTLPPPGLHYPLDGHLTAAGHSYTAEVILSWLKKYMPALYQASSSSKTHAMEDTAFDLARPGTAPGQ
jgi:hypothetical protein